MAEVFAARASGVLGFERIVAIKRVLPGHSGDARFAAMFTNEARLAAKLSHPNLVAVHDFDRDEQGQLYLVMEHVDGADLRWLLEEGALEIPVALYIAAETLRGLSYAHELTENGKPMQIVHRDVSPHNILLSRDGTVKLADFGIAKAFAETGATAPGTLKGKLGYMSPEQIAGGSVDARADLFATGVVLYEMLTGQRLFAAGSDAEVIARVLHQPIATPMEVDPRIPKDVSNVVMGFLARDREKRLPSAKKALDSVLACSSMSLRAGDLLRERMIGLPSRTHEEIGIVGPSSMALDATHTASRFKKASQMPLGYWGKTGVAVVAAGIVAAMLSFGTRAGGPATSTEAFRQEVETELLRTPIKVAPEEKELVVVEAIKEKTTSEKSVPKEKPLSRAKRKKNVARKDARGHTNEIQLGVSSSDELQIN